MKVQPMKNTKKPDLSKKGQHTFFNHLDLDLSRKNSRKNKRMNKFSAWEK